MKVPFDSLCFTVSMNELRSIGSAKVQKIISLDAVTVALELYVQAQRFWLILSSDAQFARAVLTSIQPTTRAETTPYCTELRRHLSGLRLVAVRQPSFARRAELVLEGGEDRRILVIECMGKHSNTILLDESNRILAAAKWVGKSQSRRQVLVGFTYSPPPLAERPSILDAEPSDDLSDFEGMSPFLEKWIAVNPAERLPVAQSAFRESLPRAFVSADRVPYPIALEPDWKPIERFGNAFELSFGELAAQSHLDQKRQNLIASLKRVQLAREVAINSLQQSLDAGLMARQWQLQGELILAYQHQIQPGDKELSAFDYEGNPIAIKLSPDDSAKDNAERYFRRAKRAKSGLPMAREQHERLNEDLRTLNAIIQILSEAKSPADLEFAETQIAARRWIRQQAAPAKIKEDRPYEGKAVREALSPGGYKILYGDNSEANDYLTLRLGKPNDLWFHVRGGPSAHVLLMTQNRPDRVQKPDLEYAALIAARHSSSKHSGVVPVDFTLRKYVRRQKGAALGSVIYTHEKTLHVHPKG